MHINCRYTDSNPRGCRPPKAIIYIIQDWLHKEDEMEDNMKHYWTKRSELALIDGIGMKGRRIPSLLQRHILEQLHCSHMGMMLSAEIQCVG